MSRYTVHNRGTIGTKAFTGEKKEGKASLGTSRHT